MKHFFCQIEDISLDSPVDTEVYFRGANATGLIEKSPGEDQTAVLLFINGEPGAAYLLENGRGRSMSLAEFMSLSDAHPHTINLPDVAGRLVLLALESQAENFFSIVDDESWKKQIDQWKQTNWNGLVEVRSKNSHGFFLFWQGEPKKSDLVFSTSQGFVNDFPPLNGTDESAWEVIIYSHHASAHAYQYAVLRQGAMNWVGRVLNHYHEMVGQKLLLVMDRELTRQIRPWRWNITFEEKEMRDLHFFSYLVDAAHAYRVLFMTIGAQMNFVIGKTLTQRLLDETFEQIYPNERALLQSQRLIPAAFSD